MPEYQVQPGDTLYDIAEKTLGDGQRWREIYQDNAGTIGDDPGLIHPGQRLAIPYDQPSYQEGGDYRAPATMPSRVPPPAQQGAAGMGASPFAAAEYSSAGSIAPSGSRSNARTKPPINYAAQQQSSAYQSPISGPMAGSQSSRFPVSTAPKGPAGLSPTEGKLAAATRQRAASYQRDQRVDMSSPYDPSRFNAPNQRPYTPAEQVAANQQQQQQRQDAAGPALWNQMNTQVYAPGSPGAIEANRGQPLIGNVAAIGQGVRNPQTPGAMSNPDYPYSPNAGRGVARPVSPADSQVQWPVAPGVMEQSMPQTVTPRAYGGRFTDRQGNLVAPNAYRGYTGQQPQPTNPYPQAVARQQTQEFLQGDVNLANGATAQASADPVKVIITMADGTTMIYDFATQEWQRLDGVPQNVRQAGPADPFQARVPLAGQMQQAGPVQQTTRVWNTARQNWPR